MPDDHNTKDAAVSVRVDRQLKHDLEELARSQDRSLANFVQRLLKAAVAAERKKPRP